MSDNIKVAIKVRPLIDREKNEPLQWTVNCNTITPVDSKRKGEAGFQFDHIFGMQYGNNEIFDTVVKPIVNSAVNGFNGTVFAYGQTGSGKTYTMMGTEKEAGIIPEAIDHMFDAIDNTTGREFLIRFSYFEIYNEKINDLLEVENSDLKIKEENGRIFVNNCSEKVTNGPKYMMSAMRRGEKNRSIGETNMNERSSRSHTIFRITIESREISSDSDGAIQISQLNLVDLAGSERASQTGATGDRFKEGKHINLSLSTLGLVIKQLSESQDKDKPNFVNFRDSKLTRILQASLGGNSLTAIVCTVTPATFEETYCTLSFASRAKSIKNKPKLNEDLSDEALLKRYRKQIVELSKELEKANQTIKDRQNNVLVDRVELLKEYIVTGNKKKQVRRRSCPVKFASSHSFKLLPIQENISPETPQHQRIKRRQSIIQNVNLANETFETAFADFEMDLLKSDASPDDDYFISTRRPMKPRVQFNDTVHVFNETDFKTCSLPEEISTTPRKRCNCTSTTSPGTPKRILRERLKTVIEEHEALQDFTTLEKQLNQEQVQSMNLDDNEKTLRNLKKSLEDTSILYSDVNKKYSDLQTEHSMFVEECGSLRKQVESLSTAQDRLGKMEIENKDLHTQLNAALKKQKFLEDENVSQAYQLESMQAKFKAREKELESSLQSAWQVSDPTQAQKASSEMLNLQNLVKTLTEEVEVLKTQKSQIQESGLYSKVKELEEENAEFKIRLEASRLNDDLVSQLSEKEENISELNKKLKEFEEDNEKLKWKLEEVEEKLNSYEALECDNRLKDDFESQMIEKETEINQLKLKFEEVNLENVEIKFQLSEADAKLKNYENLVEASKADNRAIEDLELKLLEKEEKLNDLAKKFEELEQINSEIKSKLTEATDQIQKYVNVVESLKSNLEEKEKESSGLYSKVKELEEENAEFKIKLEAAENLQVDDSSFCTIDSRVEEKEAEVSQLSLRIKELGDENFELKSKLEEAEEKLKSCETTIDSLNSDIARLSAKLQQKEVDFSHLNMRYKELENINNSYTKAAVQSMNNTSEEPFADLKAGVDFVQSYLAENDAIKKRLEDFEKNVSIFRENVDEQKTFVEGLEKDNLIKNEPKTSPEHLNETSTPTKMNQSIKQEIPKSAYKSFNSENDFSSIFANDSYFEKMEVSGTEERVIDNLTQNESQEITAPSMMINIFKSNDVPTLKRRIKDLETQNEQLDILYKDLIQKVNEKGSEELSNAVKEFRNVKVSLEIENARLREDLQQKIQESEDIKNGIQGLKMDIEKLQQTIYLLNSENLDLICKLNTEKQKIKEGENCSQILIDQLKTQVSQISEEKSVLKNEVSLLNEKLSSQLGKDAISPNEDIETKVREYHQKMDLLQTENQKLTVNLMDRMKELDTIKECKSLQYDHECSYKDKNEALIEENKTLQTEITELSDDLMKHIDESETTKQELDTALKKLQIYEQSQSSKSSETPEDMNNLLQEKNRLEAEVFELKSKVEKLSHENTEFTSNLSIIFDELEKNEEIDEPFRNSLSSSTTLESQSRRISNSWKQDQNILSLNSKIKTLEEQVEHLTILNTKLSDLKLSSCTQCAHLKELNENKRALKLEVKSLSNKLEDLQVKFRQKCANTEVLRMKASEELNTSGNAILNGSICEGMNITMMEENIRVLSSEKEILKEEYDKLANLYQEKCSDLETLQEGQTISSQTSVVTPNTSSKKKTRISNIESAIKNVGEDLQQHKEKLLSLNTELQKFKELKEKLKIAEESSATAEEKVKLLESEIVDLYKNIEGLNEGQNVLKSEKLNLDVEFDKLKVENQENKKRINDLQSVLEDLKGEKKCLISELEVAREEKEQLVSRQKYEDSNRETMEATLKEYRDSIDDSERRIKEISTNLNKVMKENQDLKNEITRLEILVQKNLESLQAGDERIELEEKKELECAKKLIIKEMKSLTSKEQESSEKSVSELFQVFLKTIMAKEHEIMKALKIRYDHEKIKLEEAKQQSEDAEKRANTWAKTLENDNEKLLSDLTNLEQENADLKKKIGRLESGLEEAQHENQSLREKIEVLKTDYNILQIDFEKNFNTKQDKNMIHEREKIQALIKDKEMELQSKMKLEKEEYNKKISELTNTLKNLETKNLDLKGNVDGLEANEKQLKSIIDIKTKELCKNNQMMKDLHLELEKLAEVNNKLNEDILEKNQRIEEITSLLKNKCDILSEYKTKAETLMAENDLLRVQFEERKLSIDKYKQEIETLRAEGTKEVNLFKDKFMEEEIKSAGLVKQMDELNNRNGALLLELEAMRSKCVEMEAANEKLVKKVRNSTSKTVVEKEMAELMDDNRTLENNLEGASNRISELLEAKTKAMKELVDLKGKVETVKRENEELKTAVDTFKTRHNHLIELRGKYEELLQEKNRIKLELEDKKIILVQKDTKIEQISRDLEELKKNNSELDEEAEELAEKIRENEKDIGKLEDENYFLKEKMSKEIEEYKSQLRTSTHSNMELRAQLEIMKKTDVGAVRKENEILKVKIVEIENKIETKSCGSSRSASPIGEVNKRKKRRSDLFNQKRNLGEVSDSGLSSSSADCQCSELRKTIAELEREIAMKNGVIATLHVQIQSENFPYEKKCKDLQDQLTLHKNKTRQLQQEIYNLKKTMMDTSAHECEVCKRWRLNQRHQEVQCKMEEKTYLSGMSSGVVSEHVHILKLEKEKALMRQLCRSRLAQIKQLEARIEELTAKTKLTSGL